MSAGFLPSRLPIIQAPMAGQQGVELCVAVCEAGGLGSIPSAMLTPAALRDQIAEVRARTRAPFNVNFFCHAPPAPDPDRHARVARPPRRRLCRGGPRSVGCGKRPRTRAVRRRDGGGRRGDEASGRELPFRPARSGAPRAGEGCGREGLFLRDDASPRRAGSKRAASTPSSRKGRRPAAIAACS